MSECTVSLPQVYLAQLQVNLQESQLEQPLPPSLLCPPSPYHQLAAASRLASLQRSLASSGRGREEEEEASRVRLEEDEEEGEQERAQPSSTTRDLPRPSSSQVTIIVSSC